MRSSGEAREEKPEVTETDQESPPRRRPPLDDYGADIGERTGSLMWSLARGQGG